MNYLVLCNNILILIISGWLFITIRKWEKKHKAFKRNLSDAFTLMIKEGGEREKIANEILQSLWLGHPLDWFQCRVCKRWRPFEKTGVNTQIIRDDEGKEIGHSNVVFCNDVENCIKNAEHHHIGLNNEK